MFQTTDLIEPLAQRGIRLSSSQVYRLVVERPERLSLADRVAGLLVVLYAQNAADVSRLTLGHVQLIDDSVRI